MEKAGLQIRKWRFESARFPISMSIAPHEWEICLRVLQEVSEDPSMIDGNERMKGLVTKIHREGRRLDRKKQHAQDVAHDRAQRENTGRVQQFYAAPPSLPLPGESVALRRSRPCYVCRERYSELHFFYHLLCPKCAALNWEKRQQRADLRGRHALLTGGRIKIGFETALRLLRDGAQLIVTTRFARDAVRRFGAQEDFAEWRDRLTIYSLDLRRVGDVENFARHLLETQTSLDIIIHNAAQTIRRPLAFYQPLIEAEAALPGEAPLLETRPDYPALAVRESDFPLELLDGEGLPLDTRPQNSWTLRLGEVDTIELLEVHLVNAIAPFVLNNHLKPLLLRSPFARRFVVNVSAMEGQFNRAAKTVFHPHTNMAKAALNMMTRTSAADFAKDGIYMNSVDTGWITEENPLPKRMRIYDATGFRPPLDCVDGMARIYDPIARGVNEEQEPLYGHFLKDFASHSW
jgi:NAD(P)-dependent dehydrogenase (short-subunit alcohol dehydrogenase family)